ncbi:MAG: hypothetical protein ACXWXO_00660 [Nocardioides sp.]
MTRRVASFVTWLSLLAVTAVAGGYTVTYLFQWQWVRAQIAGIAFVAALVVASTLVILSRIRRLDRRIDVLTTLAVERVRPPPEQLDPEPRPDFRWLSPPTSSRALLGGPLLALAALSRLPDQAVFIPVFLATGLVVAALASAVERLSALRHGEPMLVVPRAAPATPDVAAPRPRPALPFGLVPVIGTLVVGGVVGGLWWTTHYRSEQVGPGITSMTVEVRRSGTVVYGDATAEAIGRYCSATTGIGVRFVDVRPGPGKSSVLRVSPLLDEDAENRYTGCLQDAVVDRHWLTVTDTDYTPD